MGLFNSTVLDVAVGLIFVYLLLSIFCTTLNEWIAGILQTRSKTLKQGIAGLLDNQPFKNATFLEAFSQHPVISGMSQGPGHPSYLSSRTFATAIIDLVTPGVQGPLTVEELVKGVSDLPDGDVKKALVAMLANVQGSIDKAQQNIENWFDDSMDRVSGWYKRSAQKWTIGLALALTIMVNADTLNIAYRLWSDPGLRSAFIEGAKQKVQNPQPTPSGAGQTTVDPASLNQLSSQEDLLLGRVLGWTRDSLNVGALTWSQRVLGWILTAIAVSLGAPFWFDILNKFMNIRNAGKPPEKSSGPGKA